MRNTLEDLYYGNITPNEQRMMPNTELKQAVNRVTQCEKQLEDLLDDDGRAILTQFHPVSAGDRQHHGPGKLHPWLPAGRSDHGRMHG